MRKTLSLIAMILGLGVFIFGNHLSKEASFKENRVSEAEEEVQDNKRPIVGPLRRNIREKASENAEEKIGEAQLGIAQILVNAKWLQGAGAILFIIGTTSFFLSVRNKKRT